MTDPRWQRSAGSVTEYLDGECVVWIEANATLHHLDHSGTRVWRALGRGGGTAAEVARRVVRELGDRAPAESLVRQDIERFLVDLTRRSLTVRGPSSMRHETAPTGENEPESGPFEWVVEKADPL